MIEESLAHLDNVEVDACSPGSSSTSPRSVGADFIVKGLRAVSDFESETADGADEPTTSSGVHTLFLPSASAQLVPRVEVHPRHRPLRRRRHSMVPAAVAKRLKEKYGR